MPAYLMRSITQFHLFIYTIIKELDNKQTAGGVGSSNGVVLARGQQKGAMIFTVIHCQSVWQ